MCAPASVPARLARSTELPKCGSKALTNTAHCRTAYLMWCVAQQPVVHNRTKLTRPPALSHQVCKPGLQKRFSTSLAPAGLRVQHNYTETSKGARCLPHREGSGTREAVTHLKGSAMRPGLMTDAIFLRVCRTSAFRETPPFGLTKALAFATKFLVHFTAACLSGDAAEPSLASSSSLLSWLTA